jgi:DNA-binding NtrC family response regulator
VPDPSVSFRPPCLDWDKPAASRALYGVAAMATPSSKLILIVDDEPSIREVLTGYFEHRYGRLGYTIESASDGKEALAAVRRRRPALVMLDVEMPNMNGTDALRELRAFDDRIPVIMLTGNTSTRVAGELLKTGAFSYVPKPVKLQYLDHLVATVLGPYA